jgi:hypothetical protein
MHRGTQPTGSARVSPTPSALQSASIFMAGTHGSAALPPPLMKLLCSETNGGGRDARAPSGTTHFLPAPCQRRGGADTTDEMIGQDGQGGRDARAPSIFIVGAAYAGMPDVRNPATCPACPCAA